MLYYNVKMLKIPFNLPYVKKFSITGRFNNLSYILPFSGVSHSRTDVDFVGFSPHSGENRARR